MTPRPLHLNITGRGMEIVYLPEYPGHYGSVDHDKQQIKIRSGQQRYMEADTILHECLHVISEAFHLDLKERQVYCLAVALMALFKDNPQMLPYIQDSINNPNKYE